MTRKFCSLVVCLLAICSGLVALTWAQTSDRFVRYWGPQYSSTAPLTASLTASPASGATSSLAARAADPLAVVDRVHHWNMIAIDSSGLDHTPVAAGDTRVFGEQLGPGRSARAMAIVHVAIFDAVNAIARRYRSFTGIPDAAPGASMDAAVAQAAHDTLVALFPSQKAHCDALLAEELAAIPDGPGKTEGMTTGARAARAILARTADDGSDYEEPVMGVDFFTSDRPGNWRQDPISQLPLALGAYWGKVRPLVITSARAYRVPEPPDMASRAYTEAFNEVKRLGGDGVTTATERTADQTLAAIYWAYDGTPSLCAPPRLYNQLVVSIADQMGIDTVDLARLLALVNVAMSDAGIASWESKYHWQVWRPVTGIRESDRGTGPTGRGDGNSRTVGDVAFTPLGAPASNLLGPNFTPPFPAYPSGHAVFGGVVFQTLRNVFGTDAIPFTFVSDELNGVTADNQGNIRPLLPRSFQTLSQAEEENGQSRIYLGIHWEFDKTAGIAQGRRIANYVYRNAFRPRR
jgi:PAP2 superfamily